MHPFRKILDTSEAILVAICIAMFAAMSALGVASVFFRFVVESSLAFPDEMLRYLFVWMVALGSAVVYRHNMHAAIGIVVNVLPDMWRKSVLIFATLANMTFFAVILVKGYALTMRALPQISPALEVSMAAVYAALPVGMAFMLLYSIELVIAQIGTPAAELRADGQ